MILALLLLAQAGAVQKTRVCDKTNPARCAAVDATGAVSVSGSISASTTGRATAAAPTYIEGTDNPLSVDLTGNIRTLATAQTAASATAANPSYVEGSTSALSQDLSGHLRVGATQAGSWTNACTQSGTWTVQPGNTANTTAWKVDGSAVTQPVSGTFWQVTQPVSSTQLPVALDGSGFLKTHEQGTATVSGTVAATESGTWTVQPGNTANTTAWLVTGTGGTFPVTGTVTTTPPSNASTNVTQLAGTTTDTNSGLKSAGTLRVVLATDQPALTNKLLVTPDSVALPANQSVNVAQVAGTTTDTNSGVKSAGTIRVVLATDQPALTNKLLVTPDSVALPANQSVNVAQVGGTNTLTGGTAGSLGVGGLAAEGGAVSGNPVYSAGRGFNAIAFAPRYCDKLIAVTTLSTTATVQQIAGVANQKIYICGYLIKASTATTGINLKWTEGTGSNCVTGAADVTPTIFTTPTAAPATANWTLGPFGSPGIPWMATTGDSLCINQSATTNATTLSGVIFYTQN